MRFVEFVLTILHTIIYKISGKRDVMEDNIGNAEAGGEMQRGNIYFSFRLLELLCIQLCTVL